ncbi:MAG: adenosylcobinamide-GDP ribazoletransferase [Tannerellaceae bacterium]|jgi:adenosylcobinamide-GDP ribazoletransferase|nr:adenosylcobinamide-GDP ribazoletransferase [Tannerellaceae bacterium]
MRQIIAAFIFFTRLPFWRLATIPAAYFARILPYWPLTGWLTSGCSVLVLSVASLLLPYSVALLFAIIARLLITGCLHEDGLADFFDGFGGGASRERILAIMKDSHIGVYGATGLLLYFALFYALLNQLPVELASAALLAGDPFAKGISSMVVNRLPYARSQAEAKSGVVFAKMSVRDYAVCFIFTLLPLAGLPGAQYLLATLAPVTGWYFLTALMKKKIQGYTGDCCGALFLLCEACFYLSILLIYSSSFFITSEG